MRRRAARSTTARDRGARTPLPPEALRYTCAPALCATPGAGEGAAGEAPRVFAQTRALDALRLGLEIPSPGYNIFVTGVSGSGRMSAVEDVLAELRTRAAVSLKDRVYVHDFGDASRPRLLTLPSGRGRALERAMAELVGLAETQVRALFDSETFRAEVARVERRYRAREDEAFAGYRRRLDAAGLGLGMMGEGPGAVTDVFVLVGDTPAPLEALREDPELRAAFARARGLGPAEGLGAEARARGAAAAIDAALEGLSATLERERERLAELLRDSRRAARDLEREVQELEAARARVVLAELFTDVDGAFDDPATRAWLAQVERHMLDHLALFAEDDEPTSPEETPSFGPTPAERAREGRHDARRLYGVNVVLDTSGETLPPIVVEPNPTFVNLFGAIEREGDAEGPARAPDFAAIRAGSILRADGGYLVMYARDVLLEPGVWRTLVRTLRSRRLEIQSPEAASQLLPSALKPEPIALDLKVLLIGDEDLYELLTTYEEDFRKIFKVKAELDTHTALTPEAIGQFAATARRIEAREGLLPFEAGALAALVEQAVRWAGSRHELSTRLGDVADLMRESSYLARRAGASAVDAAAVTAGRVARAARHALADQHLSELLRREFLLVATAGERVGQINGLALFGDEPESFGKPTRITATAGAGRGGLVSIEREVHLSGPTHDKGVLILGGYLRGRYGRERPLALTASIAFEQSYGEIDGDSASLAELYALLSAIAEVPVRQSVAVTGSVNQLGDVQPVGGVNEKIEGYFHLARERGLDGSQAVLIPAGCAQTLMLDHDVIEACRQGRFAVYAVGSVDEGIPVVFGTDAERLHARVTARLDQLGPRALGEPEAQPRVEDARWRRRAPTPPEEPRPRTPGS